MGIIRDHSHSHHHHRAGARQAVNVTHIVAAPPRGGPNANATDSPLTARARTLLASSVRALADPSRRYGYPSPCASSDVDGVVDSAAALVAARSFSKAGRADLAWDFLKTLFAAQGAGGFLPRWVYLNRTVAFDRSEGAAWTEFLGPFPGPKLFPAAPEGYVPQSREGASVGAEVAIWSSNTVMAPPHHATSVLEVFYLSNQTDDDVANLEYFYDKLLRWHDHLHEEVVTSNCSGYFDRDAHENVNVPCLTVSHPWETEIEMTSPLWEHALQNVSRIVAAEGWMPDFAIPEAAKKSHDYPGDQTYISLLYLLQCLSNRLENVDDAEGGEESYDHFESACPFQMIDVGFTAALSKADKDLLQIGEILKDKKKITAVATKDMSHLSKAMLHRLYEDERGTFFNEVVNLALNSNGTYGSNSTMPMKLPLGSNFMALWEKLSNKTMVESLSSHLLRHAGEFSFSCGDYPLWSLGGCEEAFVPEASLVPSILSLRNHRAWNGLARNKEAGLAEFLRTSTLNLVCGLPNSDEADLAECGDTARFAVAFDAISRMPLGSEECERTSTLAAAIVLDMLIPDKAFAYTSEPPISSSSVIFLIAVEMVVAFGVGVVCLLLSLNLMRRAKADEEGDAFVNIVRERQEEELLVRSPVEDMAEMVATNRGNEDGTGTGAWSLNLMPQFSRMRFWERRDTQMQ